MDKKKTHTPEEMTTPDAEAMDEGVSTMPEAATETPSGDDASPGEIEEHEAEAALSNDLDHMQNELTAVNDRHLRLVAEFTNYRRRAETELAEAWARGQVDMLRSFVDGLDDLQRVGAWQADSTTVEALIEGVDLVERKFQQALEAAGVEMIDPVGELFDPNIMEAMLGVPTQDPEEDQRVQDVFQKGYSFKGHLVRPARVTVFKHE
jgi:molecular chaperone GrpE